MRVLSKCSLVCVAYMPSKAAQSAAALLVHALFGGRRNCFHVIARN